MYAPNDELPPIQDNLYPSQRNQKFLSKSNSCLYDDRKLSQKYLNDEDILSNNGAMNDTNIRTGQCNYNEAQNYLNYMMKKRNNKLYSPYNPMKQYSPYINNSFNMDRANPKRREMYKYSEGSQFTPYRKNNNINNNNYDFSTIDGYRNFNQKNFFGGLSKNEVRRSRINEITNPEKYYKRNGVFESYREEQKKFLRYNYELMKQKNQVKQYIDINPYNPQIIDDLGKSELTYNTILNPMPNFTYNKYLESQLTKIGQNKISRQFYRDNMMSVNNENKGFY